LPKNTFVVGDRSAYYKICFLLIFMQYDIATIIQSYAQGYFLMADENDVLGWYGSRDRTLIPLDERFRYPKSLQRVLNQERFQSCCGWMC
jgi:Leu/Phe-tRNA-protein transferase